jgi:4-aminobutyrate aminotransferase-like enzyme
MKAVKNLVKKASRTHKVGAVILEPIQGRGGVIVPPQNFLPELRNFCNEESILLIADEIFTGFGRTGSMFAVEKSNVVPDILCLGKGMAAGFPVSACISTARIMHSWGQSTGEALHTSTFLGWPLGCAVALAVIKEIEEKKLVDRSRQMGEYFRKKLYELKQKHAVIGDVRGSGLMIGIELVDPLSKKPVPAPAKAKQFVEESLKAGIILLPCGPDHNVISLTPPLIISEKEIDFAVGAFDKILKKLL